MAIKRILFNLANKVRMNNKRVVMEIPHVGLLMIKNNIVGVKFKDHLIKDTRVNYIFKLN